MSRPLLCSAFVFAGLFLLPASRALAQANPVPSPSPAPQNAAPAGAQQDAHVPAPATSPATSPASAASAPSANARLLLANADKLVDLAQQLKSEMDKTNQYVFSLNTVRRAEDVEKLAKELQKQLQHVKK
jgi:hypothetical protein